MRVERVSDQRRSWGYIRYAPTYGGGSRLLFWLARASWLMGILNELLRVAAVVVACGAAMGLVSGFPMSRTFRALAVVAFGYLGVRAIRRDRTNFV